MKHFDNNSSIRGHLRHCPLHKQVNYIKVRPWSRRNKTKSWCARVNQRWKIPWSSWKDFSYIFFLPDHCTILCCRKSLKLLHFWQETSLQQGSSTTRHSSHWKEWESRHQKEWLVHSSSYFCCICFQLGLLLSIQAIHCTKPLKSHNIKSLCWLLNSLGISCLNPSSSHHRLHPTRNLSTHWLIKYQH